MCVCFDLGDTGGPDFAGDGLGGVAGPCLFLTLETACLANNFAIVLEAVELLVDVLTWFFIISAP